MAVELHLMASPLSYSEWVKLNENWERIMYGFSNIQDQIRLLTGGVEVDEIIDRVNKAVTNAETTTAEMQELISEVDVRLSEIQTAITNANNAADDANTLNVALTVLKGELETLQSNLQGIVDSENTRVQNENARIQAESEREAAEQTRVDNEGARIEAETARQQAEQARVQAEQERETTFNLKMLTADEKIALMQDIISNLKSYNYDSEVVYDFPNLIAYNGSTFIVLQEVSGITPIDDGVNYRLVARKGVDGTGAVSSVNGVLPDENGNVELLIPGVLDNLESTSTTDALSANQGRLLKALIDDLGEDKADKTALEQTDTNVSNLSQTINNLGTEVTEHLADVAVNVKKFGALGNANYFNSNDSKWYEDSSFTILANDDTTPIQNAINYAEQSNGILYFPEGNYIFTSNMTISSGMKFISGGGKVKLIHSGKDYVGININNTQDLLISGLSFIGDDITNPMTLTWIESNEGIKFYNCYFGTMGGSALSFSKCNGVYIDKCYFTDIGYTAVNGDGTSDHPSKPAIWVGEYPNYTNVNVNITQCKFYNTHWSAIYYFAKSGVIDGNDFEGCRESTIFADTAENVKITNNKINCGTAVNIANFGIEYGSGRFFTISNNIITNAGESGIAISSGQYFTISENQCINNGKATNMSEQQRSGIIIREYSSTSQTKRGVIKGNICKDTNDVGSKSQLFGLSTYRDANALPLEDLIIEGNDFSENAISSVRVWDESTLFYDTVRFRNNIGYAEKPKTLSFQTEATTGLKQFIGFGFRPSFVEIYAYIDGTEQWCSLTYDTRGAGVGKGVYHFGSVTKPISYLLLTDSSGNAVVGGDWSSLLNDGFQLVFNNASLPVNLVITCHP